MPSTSSAARRPAASNSRRQGSHLPADHSGRIVYADPRSLPSYPTVGVKLDCTNSAALQAATQTKSPSAIIDTSAPVNPASLKAATAAAAASAALFASPRPASALHPAPTPEPSEPAPSLRLSKRHSHQRMSSEPANTKVVPRSASSLSTRPPVDTSTWGNTAATQAFRNNRISMASIASAPPEKPIPEIAALGHQPSLRAAKGAMKSANDSNAPSRNSVYVAPGPSLRPKSMSASASSLRHQKSLSSHYPDGVSAGQASSSAANALKAATAATKARGDRSSFYSEAGAVPYTTMGRQMYTSHPSIGPEHDDQAHEKMLHASALAMAKRMYNPQAGGNAGAPSSSGTTQGTTLQEAAYKLAQERLEKLHEKYAKDREYRDHYVDPNFGSGGSSGSVTRRFSMRGRLRRQHSSSDMEDADDESRARDLHNDLSQVSSKIANAEEKKRQDRKSVLLAAQRNVKSQLHDIDEKVYADSGRVPPATLSSWEGKAHTIAQARADAHLSKYPRAHQVDIGGGKFMNRSEVDQIATRRVQPVIDDIHEKAQAEFERQEAERQVQDERKAEAAMLKSQDKELKEMRQKLKQEEKNKKRAQKAEEKARKADSKGTKRRSFFLSKAHKEDATPVSAAVAVPAAHESDHEVDDIDDTDSEVMTAPDTSSSVRGPHDADSETPTTDPGHATPAAEPSSKPREQVAPVSPESTGARSNLVAPAALVTTAAVVPAVVLKTSASRPDSVESSTVTAPTSPVTAAPASTSETAPAAFTEPRAAPSVPTTPTTASAFGAAPAGSAASVAPRNETGATDKARPLSTKSAGSSSPKSKSKLKSWLKTKFTRPRSVSAASATGASQTGTEGKAAAPKSTGADFSADKSFAGGHTLKTAETGSAQEGRGVTGTTTAIGSGNLSLPAIGGIAGGFAAGTDAAATAAANKVANLGNSTTITSAPRPPDSGIVAPSKERLNPGLLDVTGQSKTSGTQDTGSSVSRKPLITESPSDAAILSEASITKTAEAPTTQTSMLEPFAAGRAGTLGETRSLTPETTGLTEPIAGTNDKESDAGFSGVHESGAAVEEQRKDSATIGETGTPGIKTFTTGLKNGADDRASVASSSYSTDGAAGARGGMLGFIGTKILAAVGADTDATTDAETKAVTGAEAGAETGVETEASADAKAANSFVTVPPPTTAPSTGTAGTASGESGVDTAYTHLPPKTLNGPVTKKSVSPSRDSRFLENLEDHF